MAIMRRRPGAHRKVATTRSQLFVAAVSAAVVAVLLGAAGAQAVGEGAETAAAQSPSPGADLLQGAPFAGPTVSTTDGTSALSPDTRQLVVSPVLPGGSYTAVLPTAPVVDAQVTHGLTVDDVRAANSGLYEQTEARLQPDGDHYGVTLVVRHRGHVALRLDRVSGGRHTVLARTGKVDALVAGRPLLVQLRVVGDAPVELRARVWQEGEQAPDWQVSATDGAPERITAAGSLALQGYLSRHAETASLSLSDVAVAGLVSDAPSDPPAAGAPRTPTTAPAPEASPAASLAPSPAETPAVSTPRPSTPPTASDTTPTGGVVGAPDAGASTPPTSSAPPAPSTPSAADVVPASGGGRTSDAGFVHPGIMTSADQLAFVRAKVAAGQEPWASAFAKAKGSSWANLSWQPQPVEVVACGAYNRIDVGCTAETKDAQAAYTMALIYTYSGDERYARKAIEILDAWSATLEGHRFDTTTHVNGRLQAAWAGSVFPKAAELLRHSDAGWSPDRVQRFEEMLRTAFLPMVRDGWTGGNANWQMSMAEATVSIGVFLDDRAVFEDGVGDWRSQVVSSVYLSSDGPQPVVPAGTTVSAARIGSYWFSPTRFVDGLQGETCRDADHMMMGLAAALDVAETARIQGLDLYGEQQRRLVSGLEYNARYLNDPSAPGWACPAPLRKIGTASNHGWEVGYAHYAALGASLPETQRLVRTTRPKNGTELFMNWSTLTHARS